MNYRSQNSILQLANNIVKLLQTVFPWSIDAMTEEVSERLGPKPTILEPMGDKLLCHYFFGRSNEQVQVETSQLYQLDESNDFEILDDDDDAEGNANGQKPAEEKKQAIVGKSTPHFGASQVVIVRD